PVQYRNNPQDLADQAIEALRIASERGFRLARRAVALTDLHAPPVGVSRTGGWIENDLARGVRPTGELHEQDLAGSALECGIRNVRVGPLDDDSLDHGLAWGTNHRSGHVCGRIQTRKILVVRHTGSGERSFLVVHRVEFPV